MIALITSSLAFSLSFLLFFIYQLKKGRFKDEEDIKYQIFRDDEK